MSGRRASRFKEFLAFARAHKMWVIVPFLLVFAALAALILIASVPTVPFFYMAF